MKKAASLVLYVLYAAIALGKQALEAPVKEMVAQSFQMGPAIALTVGLSVVTTLILLLRLLLAERTFSVPGLVLDLVLVAATAGLFVWAYINVELSSLLLALLTETVVELVLLLAAKGRRE